MQWKVAGVLGVGHVIRFIAVVGFGIAQPFIDVVIHVLL
ncbi:hypothetical protein ADIS_1986 [Lunatimonas lonarensis]|uniref:Uncharacterized protein n=1 Tax=Lunatimonas lonarensis TaxID=1232681 RepID=R7ZTX8_9BACT|nr:hypothetical protein ADIS_1986 [Lunatimonas lonarensis]